jgi:hypothetical protein
MSDTVYVTPAQVLAAKLAIELSEEDGEEPDAALRVIANAQVVTEEADPVAGTQKSPSESAFDYVMKVLADVKPAETQHLAETMQSGVSELIQTLDLVIPELSPAEQRQLLKAVEAVLEDVNLAETQQPAETQHLAEMMERMRRQAGLSGPFFGSPEVASRRSQSA